MSPDLNQRISQLRGRVHATWTESRAEHVLSVLERRQKRRKTVRRAAQGGLLLLLLVTPFVLHQLYRESASPPEPSAGLRLADGSVVTSLSADTELNEAASVPGRTVLRLLRGSARFQVRPNPQRIFRVEAGRTAVEVLGTQFTVTRRNDRTDVAVLEGRVRVLWDSNYAELRAGESGVFPPPGSAGSSAPGTPADSAPPPASPAPDAAAGADGTYTLLPPSANKSTDIPLRPSRQKPAAPGLAKSDPAQPPNRAEQGRWRTLAQNGQFDQAYGELETSNLAAASDEPGDLLLLADVARLSHHPAAAVAPLEKLLREHRSDPRAALAAFTLGRILLDDLGKPREAAAVFLSAQSLDPDFAMIEDALAREVQALWRAGDSAAAHERALLYLRRFPTGRQVRSVRRFGAID